MLNFGQPAPIDIRVSGPDNDEAYALAAKLAHDLRRVPGIVDSHVFQVPDAPALTVNVDRHAGARVRPGPAGDRQQSCWFRSTTALQVAPNFWLNPQNSVSYPLVVQTPTYRIDIGAGPADDAGRRQARARTGRC